MNTPHPTPAPPRQSNFELLRILAMLLVLIVHADYHTLGAYRPADLDAHPANAATRLLVEQGAIGCVNLFVLISGWFGLRPRARRIGGFLFQYAFFALLPFALAGLLPDVPGRTLWDAVRPLVNFDAYWFVPSYLVLCLLAPGLNAFVEQGSPRRLATAVGLFFALQTVCAWALDGAAGIFCGGYSPLSFVGLYLLARLVRTCPHRFMQGRARTDFVAAFALVVVPAAVEVALYHADGGAVYSWWRQHALSYLAPHVIAGPLFLLNGFAKLRFTSPLVNAVAASAFAAYLFHLHPLLSGPFRQAVRRLYDSFSGLAFLALTAGLLLLVFACAVGLDRVRLLCWRWLEGRLFPPRAG